MKILFATGIYPPESGGPATFTHGVAHACTERGHAVSVVTYGECELPHDTQRSRCEDPRRATDEERGEVKVRWVSRRGGILLRYARYAWAVYREGREADVIFAQGAVSEGLPATLAAWFLRKRLVMRVPGDYAWEMGMQVDSSSTEVSLDRFLMRAHRGRVGLYEKLERWTARRAWSLIVPSRYLQSVVERWGVPSERIEVIKNAVAFTAASKSREGLRKEFRLQNKTVCLTAARAVPWKGVGELIRWWHRLPDTHVLVYAGDGPELGRWRDLAKQEGVEDRVLFLGRVSPQLLAAWYEASDVYLLHTGYEGYPHTVPEAISHGLPCFVSDQGGNPETVGEFGDRVKVLPYQQREAWVQALQAIPPRSVDVQAPMWTHTDVVKAVEAHLKEASTPSFVSRSQAVMVSYERELLKTESGAFQRIASLARVGFRVSALVVAALPADVALEYEGVRIQGFAGSAWRRVVRAIVYGVREVKRLPGRTIVSGQDPFAAGWIAYAISCWTNQPLEIQEHGDFWSGTWVQERFAHRVWSLLGRVLLSRAERVRVVSERVKDHLILQGVSADKIDVIPVAQDVSKLFALPCSSKERVPVFLVPCRFVEQKGLDVFLEGFRRLRQQGLAVRARFVGAGPLDAWLRKQVLHHGLSEVIEIRNWMDSNELWSDAEVLVVSSRYEGWGRTIVEAMAAGVPVVTTEVGCVGSFFRPGIDGRSVPVGDADQLALAMRACIENEAETEKMCAAARERARAFPVQDALHAQQQAGWVRCLQHVFTRIPGPRFDLWVIGFVAFAVFTRLTSAFLFHQQLLYREWGFFTLVDRWFQGYGYSFAADVGCNSAYRSPGYLFFLTALYSIFDRSNTLAQALVQNAFVVGALWLTYAVGKRLVGKRAALVGAFLMACYPYTFYHYTQFYHTFLQSFFLLLVLWCVMRLEEARRWPYAIAGGVAIGALAYVQGTILPATPFIALWLFWRLRAEWRRAVLYIAIMALVSVALIAPWSYRNWKIFGHFVPLTTDLGHALFKANNENIYEITQRGYPQEIIEDIPSSTNPLYKQYRLPLTLEEELRSAGVLRDSILWTEWHPREPSLALQTCADRGVFNEYTFNQYWLERTKTFWRENWGWEVWRLPLQKISTFWRPGLFPSVKTGAPWSFAGSPWKVWFATVAVTVSTGVVILLGWLGLLTHIYRKQRYVFLPFILMVVFTLLHALVAGYTKYRIPIDHLLAAYAGWVMVALWDWIRGRSSV